MSKQIDELFSPERLRKNWKQAQSKKPDENPEQKNKNAPMSAFDALAASLQEHFYKENLTVLNLLMDSLYPVWESLFVDNAGENDPEMDAAEMISMAHELLNQIEDLSFAFSLNKNTEHS
ncbi:MAG: hypothetical protein ABFD57_03085 [Smithella sp.]